MQILWLKRMTGLYYGLLLCAITFCLEYPPFITFADASAETAVSSTVKTTASQPTIFSITINHQLSNDIEAIVWPDGSVSIPVKLLAQLLELFPQESESTSNIFLMDTYLKRSVEISWQTGMIRLGDQVLEMGKHPLIRIDNGFLVKKDVFVDQDLMESLFNIKLIVNPDSATIDLQTERPLKALSDSLSDTAQNTENQYFPIPHPDILSSPIERIYLSESSNTNYQIVQQSGDTQYIHGISNILSTGVQGWLFGDVSYYVKPSFIRFNGKTNVQSIDWLFQKEGSRFNQLVGNMNAGLSPLVAPSLPLWGLKFSTKNAVNPQISPLPYRVYDVKPHHENSRLDLVLNNRTVQSLNPGEEGPFEPVYLQTREPSQIQILENDGNGEPQALLTERITYFSDVLSAKESAFSAFLGRVPLQFQPILANQQSAFLMPQSEKWLAGGRFYYGVTDRLTVGISGAANRIFGRPKTFFLNPFPFSENLTGTISYQRDPNFLQGQAIGLSSRYRLANHWSLFADGGTSLYQLKPGSRLTELPRNGSGKALKTGIQYLGTTFNAEADVFHYDTDYYSLDSLFNSYLYDREGIGSGIRGSLQRLFNTNYQLRWDGYRTNLANRIPGGIINANHWFLSTRMNPTSGTFLGLNLDWTGGENEEKQLIQRYTDITLDKHLPKGLQAQVRLTRQLANFIFSPADNISISSPYKNNGFETSLDIPMGTSLQNHIQIGHMTSTFVDYGFIKSAFQYKRLFAELSLQKSYGDKRQHLDNMGIRLGYQFPSGRKIGISYWILKNDIFFANTAPTHINTHQFFFDFSDVIGLIADRFQSIGQQGSQMSSLSGKVFVDVNLNGKPDQNEPGVRDIRLLLDNTQSITTDSDGRYTAALLENGYHTLGLQTENLPILLDSKNPAYKIKLTQGRNHRFDIALLPRYGVISGHVLIQDINGATITGDQVILVLLNRQGEVLHYTSSEADGTYQFANLAPGTYIIDMEPGLKASGQYKILSSTLETEIQPSEKYDEVVHREGLNFKLLKLE